MAKQHHFQNNSPEDHKFSFPKIIPAEEQGFEFGCNLTPDSPKSPADHLFFNGKLQPHTFPTHPPTNPALNINLSRSISRTSSIGSMDSLLSSRSNSRSSSSRSGSSCSSARTSISEASCLDRRSSANNQGKVAAGGRKNAASRGDSFWLHYQAKKPELTPHFSSSRRWQFLTPAPALKSQSSRRMRALSVEREGSRSTKESKDGTGAWFSGRIFKWFVSACLSCHAINSSAPDE